MVQTDLCPRLKHTGTHPAHHIRHGSPIFVDPVLLGWKDRSTVSDNHSGHKPETYVAEIILVSGKLINVNINESQLSLISLIAHSIPETNSLRALDISTIGVDTPAHQLTGLMQGTGRVRMSKNDVRYAMIRFIVMKGKNLTDLIAVDTQLSTMSIDYLCNYLTNTMLRLYLSNLRVGDHNIINLVTSKDLYQVRKCGSSSFSHTFNFACLSLFLSVQSPVRCQHII